MESRNFTKRHRICTVHKFNGIKRETEERGMRNAGGRSPLRRSHAVEREKAGKHEEVEEKTEEGTPQSVEL